MQIAHRPEYVGAVGALAAPGPDQAARLEVPQHLVQQEVLGVTGQQASSKFSEHAEVKAGVIERQAKCIFPVNTRAHSIGGLPIAQVFEKLQHRDQR